MRRVLLLVLLAASAPYPLAGCDSGVEAEDRPLVVSAFLEAGASLPPVTLTRVAPLFEPFDPSRAGVAGAEVSVSLLGPDGSAEETTRYLEFQNGTYQAIEPGVPRVLPGRTYRLDVTGPGGERLTAQTTVPPDFEILEEPPPSVVYGSGLGPTVRLTLSSTAARRAVFVLSTQALAPAAFERVVVDGETRYRGRAGEGAFLPVPIVRRFADCEEEADGALLCEQDPAEDFGRGTSPVLNEDSYINLGDGTARVQIPFIAFGFFGPQEVTFLSLDGAFQDFVETQAIQFAPTTLSPGEIPNVTTNVEGGLGVFGSFVRETVETTVTEG